MLNEILFISTVIIIISFSLQKLIFICMFTFIFI